MKRIHWLLATALIFAIPACDNDDDDDTQGSATDGDGSDSGDSSDGSGGGSDGSGGSSDGSGGGSDGSGGGSDGSGGGSGDDLKPAGQPCQFSDECQGDVCLFTNGDDEGLCSRVCEDWSDCPDFWDCVEVENTAYKACFPGD